MTVAILGALADLALILAALTVACLIAATAWLGYRAWRDRQRAIGYGYGSVDGHKLGDADGFARGYSQAALDHVLAAPALDDHFTEALLSGALHEPVSEEMAALLAAVQEHERAARTEAGR